MISVVIPCYNETDVLELTYETLNQASRTWGDAVELILVDDGSQDDTWAKIDALTRRDPRVRGVRLSRNFGHQAALGAGLERAAGDVVVVLDADLQDPPSLVGEMLSRWRAGFDVVYAQRNRRHGETWFKKVSCSLFYRLLNRINSVDIPPDTGDFALMDARVVRTLLEFREHAMFWRGLRCWSGFRQTAVRFDRPGRAAGVTKYTLRKLVQLASNGLLSFSELPLRLALYAGAAALSISFALAGGSLVAWLAGWDFYVSPTALALLSLGSLQLVSLGLMGEYINRIYDEVRARPRWIVAETAGYGEGAQAESQTLRKAG